MQQGRAIALGLACALLACCSPGAQALDPALDAGQYGHTAWRSREGFARGVVSAFAQTPDGYLWMGTQFGLFRFDGVRNVAWQPPPNGRLPSEQIRRLF